MLFARRGNTTCNTEKGIAVKTKMRLLPSCQECDVLSCSFFGGSPAALIEKLDKSKGGNLYKRGQNIFFQGTRPSGMFCIYSGKVKVYKIDHTGKEQIVRLARNGDILGYRSLIGGEYYSSFAAALEDSLICFIPREVFFEMLQSDDQLNMKLMRLLSRDLGSAEERIAKMAQKPVRERLAETLLMLQNFYGRDEQGEPLAISLTREDLANIVGTATETVIRFLSEFRQSGLIALEGRKIRLTDPQGLLRIASLYE